MAKYTKLSASDKRARIVAPKVAKARRLVVAKSALGRVSAKATSTRTNSERKTSARAK